MGTLDCFEKCEGSHTFKYILTGFSACLNHKKKEKLYGPMAIHT